jgi:hypothetical protein
MFNTPSGNGERRKREMKKQLFVGFMVFALCLAAPSATAGDCKKIIAQFGPDVFLGECSYEGEDYVWCGDFPVTGNLRGTWHSYGRPAYNAFDLTVPDVLGIPGWNLWVVWYLCVFETHKGNIITQENEIINPDTYFTYGALSGMAFIIGGTGDYEGATGWIGAVGTEAEGGVLRGEICTP